MYILGLTKLFIAKSRLYKGFNLLEANNKLYDMLIRKLKECGVTLDLDKLDAQVLDAATVEKLKNIGFK